MTYFINLSEQQYVNSLCEQLKKISKKEDLIISYLGDTEILYPLDSEEMCVIDFFHKFHDILQNHEGQIFYLSSDMNISQRYDEWCNFYGTAKKFNVLLTPFYLYPTVSDENILEIQEKNKNFCCLCSNPTVIRAMLLDFFYKHDNFIYSMAPYHDVEPIPGELVFLSNPMKWDKNFERIVIYETYYNKTKVVHYDGFLKFKEFLLHVNTIHMTKNIFSFPNGFKLSRDYKRLTEIDTKKMDYLTRRNNYLPLECYKSCCDVVMETSPIKNSVFFTEKTMKEILYNRPYLCFGAKKQNIFLKKLGFELYDEIFDYSFDSDLNVKERLNLFVEQIKKYLDFDIFEFDNYIQNNIKDKIDYNRIKLIEYGNKFLPIYDDLNKYEKNQILRLDKKDRILDFFEKNQFN